MKRASVRSVIGFIARAQGATFSQKRRFIHFAFVSFAYMEKAFIPGYEDVYRASITNYTSIRSHPQPNKRVGEAVNKVLR